MFFYSSQQEMQEQRDYELALRLAAVSFYFFCIHDSRNRFPISFIGHIGFQQKIFNVYRWTID